MKKRVIDLTAEELDRFAREAWSGAARDALAAGLPITGSRDGRILKYFPDGHVEDLGPVAPLADRTGSSVKKRSRKSVA